MEVNKIQEELARLIELVDGWAGSHDVPGIERDLVLDKLKKLYEAIRFANFDEGDSSASASVAAQQSVAEVAPVQLDDYFPNRKNYVYLCFGCKTERKTFERTPHPLCCIYPH